MRFSLLTLVLVAVWVGTAGLVYHRWDPWFSAAFPSGETQLSEATYFKQFPTWPQKDSYKRSKSPDGTRSLNPAHGGFAVSLLCDQNDEFLCAVPVSVGFVDDDRIVCVDGKFSPKGEFSYGYYFPMHRRHPEWWWGHFYRPEVWGLVVLTVALGWRFANAVRARSKNARAAVQ